MCLNILINSCVTENIGKLWLQSNHELLYQTIESYTEKEIQKHLQLSDKDFIYVRIFLNTL